MNPWFMPWWGYLQGPLSGDVTQAIAPFSDWLSPQFEFNFAGNRKIEAEVVADVASYGKQLGLISDALLELARGNPGQAISELEKLDQQIDAVKERHRHSLERSIRSNLTQLRLLDREAFEHLLQEYR